MNRLIWDISEELRAEIRHFPPHLKQKVWNALDEIAVKPESGKALAEELEGFHSYRIGTYRLIYSIEGSRLRLKSIGPRKTVYEAIILELARGKIKERAAKYEAAKRLNKPKRLKRSKGLIKLKKQNRPKML